MSSIKLYIATSIDGFIARENGNLDWLEGLPNSNKTDHGYAAFYETIDVVVMGRSTYESVLGFDVDWPYPDCQTFVFSSIPNFTSQTKHTRVLHQLNSKSLEQIHNASRKDIWVVGGGQLITAFLNQGLIDEMILSIIPVILGRGIALFPDHPAETRFQLISSEAFDTGVVNLRYRKF